MPRITAGGAGAVSRFNTGLVIATGLSIGALLTLFVVPALHMMLGAEHGVQSSQPENNAPRILRPGGQTIPREHNGGAVMGGTREISRRHRAVTTGRSMPV